MDWARSCKLFLSKAFLGWRGVGTKLAMGSSCAFDNAVSASGEGEDDKRAPNPRPKPCLALMGKHLLGQLEVGCRARGAEIVKHDRLAVARRLGDSYVPRDNGLHDLAAQVPLDFVFDLGGEARPAIEHGQDYSLDLQPRIEGVVLTMFDGR